MPRRKAGKPVKPVHVYPTKALLTVRVNDPGVNPLWTELVLKAYPVESGVVIPWEEATKKAAVLAAHNIIAVVTPLVETGDLTSE